MQQQSETDPREIKYEEDQLIQIKVLESRFWIRPDTPKILRVLLKAWLFDIVKDEKQQTSPTEYGMIDLFQDNYQKFRLLKWLAIYDVQWMTIIDQARPTIIEEISLISKMPRLKKLNLVANQISNIEALSFLACPQLQFLSLDDNWITNIKPLDKSHFLRLKELSLNGDYQMKINRVNRMSASKIRYFYSSDVWPESSQRFKQNVLFTVFCKIQSSVLEHFSYLHWFKQGSVNSWSKYKDRFPNIK